MRLPWSTRDYRRAVNIRRLGPRATQDIEPLAGAAGKTAAAPRVRLARETAARSRPGPAVHGTPPATPRRRQPYGGLPACAAVRATVTPADAGLAELLAVRLPPRRRVALARLAEPGQRDRADNGQDEARPATAVAHAGPGGSPRNITPTIAGRHGLRQHDGRPWPSVTLPPSSADAYSRNETIPAAARVYVAGSRISWPGAKPGRIRADTASTAVAEAGDGAEDRRPQPVAAAGRPRTRSRHARHRDDQAELERRRPPGRPLGPSRRPSSPTPTTTPADRQPLARREQHGSSARPRRPR